MQEAILTINAGSSTVKFAIFNVIENANVRQVHSQALYRGILDRDKKVTRFVLRNNLNGVVVDETVSDVEMDFSAIINYLYSRIISYLQDHQLVAVGHRVVHGGTKYSSPIEISENVMAALTELIPLAPLHQPHNLEAIRIIKLQQPQLPQVACFDTAFHNTQTELVQLYALPYDLYTQGIRRYGFHGLSYEHIAGILTAYMDIPSANGRIIVAHLGSGASLCAMMNRKSMATTMGFSPLDGIPMATRPGNIDPGVLLYLLDQKKMNTQQLTTMLYRQSGLLGISGISGDMRELINTNTEGASKAINLFVYRIIREIGSLVAALNGLDEIIFTGGIGEHSSKIRELICAQLQWLNVELNDKANKQSLCKISTENSAIGVWVLPSDEEFIIAQHTCSVVSGRHL